MRVVHLTYSADGGAGRAARRAHIACLTAGLESRLSFISGGVLDDTDILVRTKKFESTSMAAALFEDLQWDLIPQARTNVSGTMFSIAYPAVDLSSHPVITSADIIHLHWPTWVVSPPMLRRWLDSEKAVFITLHDMWMFTGGCHYTSGCTQFETLCMKCPQIADRLGIASANFDDKLRNYGGRPDLHLVTPSEWMGRMARSSRILGQADIAHIPNPIETDIFSVPVDRDALRQAIGIGANDFVMLFGNFDNGERRKGGQVLIDALERVASDGSLLASLEPGARAIFMVFGKGADLPSYDRVAGLNMGEIKDDRHLADIYAMADLLCFPSLEDNYPNTIVEAAACGTPAVAFETGGMAEMIETGVTGLLVPEVGSSAAFADAMLAFAARHHKDEDMRAACRERVLKVNSLEAIGTQLADAYERARPQAVKPGRRRTSSKEISRRAAAVLSSLPTAPDPLIGSEFARFPVDQYLKERASARGDPDPDAQPKRFQPSAPREKTGRRPIKLMAVRTFHEHHSARSGPYQYLRYLPPDDYEISNILVPLGDDLVAERPVRNNMRQLGRTLGLQGFAPQANAWLAESSIANWLAREPFDIVHFIDGELGGWLVSGLPPEFFTAGRPALMSTFHQPPGISKDMMTAQALAGLDRLVVVARSQVEELEGIPSAPPVAHVPHGIDVDFFAPPQSDPRQGDLGGGDGGGPLRLLSVGHWLRNYALAFATIEALRRKGVEVDYRIVSPSKPDTPLPANVALLKGLTDEELRDEYHRADVLFLPLENATANNALLESMACGTPVVSTNIGGTPEFVDQTCGILCAPEVDAMVDALTRLSKNAGLRARLAQGARRRALQYDWRRVAQSFDTLYKSIVAERASRTEAAA